MYDVLRGSPWEILRAFLSPDILLRLRTTERYWNKCDNYGPYGDFFLFLLKSGGEDVSTAHIDLGPASDVRLGLHYVHESGAKR